MRGVENRAGTEVVDYRRSTDLPGVEVLDAQRSPREWRVIPNAYSVVVFQTWQGVARARGRTHVGEPGLAFCSMPGELLIGRPHGSGSFHVLQLEPEVLEHWLAEQQSRSVRPEWKATMKPISAQLRQRFSEFFGVLRPATPAMQVQSQLLELSEVMVGELIQGARKPRLDAGLASRGAARMRECLNEEGINVDLETLAQRAGLSRFQALRAFKQRYGLPPHAYQLCLRMNHARRWLLEGVSASDVALRCGFADQSHFNRHFKRFNAVTPMQYVRALTPSLSARRGRHADGAVIARSDRRGT